MYPYFFFEYETKRGKDAYNELLEEVNLTDASQHDMSFVCKNCMAEIVLIAYAMNVPTFRVRLEEFKNCHDIEKILKYAEDDDNVFIDIRDVVIEGLKYEEVKKIIKAIELSDEKFLNKIAKKCEKIRAIRLIKDDYTDSKTQKSCHRIILVLECEVKKKNIKEIFETINAIKKFAEVLHIASVI